MNQSLHSDVATVLKDTLTATIKTCQMELKIVIICGNKQYAFNYHPLTLYDSINSIGVSHVVKWKRFSKVRWSACSAFGFASAWHDGQFEVGSGQRNVTQQSGSPYFKSSRKKSRRCLLWSSSPWIMISLTWRSFLRRILVVSACRRRSSSSSSSMSRT